MSIYSDSLMQRGVARGGFPGLRCLSVPALLILVGFHLIPTTTEQSAFRAKATFFCRDTIVERLEFDRKGETLASLGLDGKVQLWDLVMAREMQSEGINERLSYCLTYSPDGKTMVTGGLEEIRVWDVSRGYELESRRPSGLVRSMAFSPDGKSLLTTDCEGAVRLWDTVRWSESAGLDTLHSGSFRLAFAPSGIRCARITSDTRVRVWKGNPGGAPTFQMLPAGNYFSMAFSNDGRHLFAGSRDGVIQVWDVENGRALRRFEVGGWVTCLDISLDGRRLAYGNHEGTITVFEIETQRILLRTRHQVSMKISAIRFSPDGRLLASGGNDSTIKIWEIPDTPADTPRTSLAQK
jgi:WD40 repeat protein